MKRFLLALVAVGLAFTPAPAGLSLNQLSGMVSFPRFYQLAETNSRSGGATQNITSVDIGAPDPARRVIVAVAWRNTASANRTLDGVSANGTNLGLDAEANATSVPYGAQVYSGVVTDGQIVTVTLTFSGSKTPARSTLLPETPSAAAQISRARACGSPPMHRTGRRRRRLPFSMALWPTTRPAPSRPPRAPVASVMPFF